MKLKPLSMSDMEPIRNWRNEQMSMLRTSFPLTQGQQLDFYSKVICNRNANARYWGIYEEVETDYAVQPSISFEPIMIDNLIGMAGIENIQWENRLGEISLLLMPSTMPNTMNKYGGDALNLILYNGFLVLNLENIFTEVYHCSPYIEFWAKQSLDRAALYSILPNRKFYAGNYHDSMYINFKREDFLKHENITTVST
jgi:RimJ/RimL family protein N-acetyltransferase